jgi:sortase A
MNHMTTRTSSRPGQSCLINLLALAVMLLIIAGAIIAYPVLHDALTPPPAAFGEVQTPLRPTVTPLPGAGHMAISAAPELLPETPVLAPGQSALPSIAAQFVATDPAAKAPTRIVIPAINLDAPVEPVGWSQVNGVSTWDIPNHFAAGWLKTSAPLGRPGNTVLNGHHNIAGEVFRYLVDLKAGDLIEVYSDAQRVVYEVRALRILPDRDQPLEIRWKNAEWIQPTVDERLTLVTCWPYANNTHRLIVVASPIGLP